MSLQIENLLPDFTLPLITPRAFERAAPTACRSELESGPAPAINASSFLQDCQAASVAALLGGPLGYMPLQIDHLSPDFTLPLITPRAFVRAAPTAWRSELESGPAPFASSEAAKSTFLQD